MIVHLLQLSGQLNKIKDVVMADRRDALMQLFGAKGVKVNTNRGAEYYDNLAKQMQERLTELENTPAANRISIDTLLDSEGLTRRDFMKWSSAMCAALMLPATFTPMVAKAAELMNRVPVIWIELQDCAGNSEAILRSDAPTIDELILETISLEFNETLMAAAGHRAEEHLEEAMKTFEGKYLCVVEGSVPIGDGLEWCTIGAKAESFQKHLFRIAGSSATFFAV